MSVNRTSREAGMVRRLLILVLVLALAMLTTPGLTAAAATASASDMRLVSTTGSVTLQNINGKTLSVRADMKLYNGYTLSTGQKSYAYVSLDSTKAVKLDACTQVEVRKQGNKLELLVVSGKLFFNVTAPLSSNQTLNIRTSTMVTGVRGTSGIVSVQDGDRSTVAITDGRVEVTAANTAGAGVFQSVEVGAGQIAHVSVDETGTRWQADVSDMDEGDVPGFAAVELARDPQLRQRVAEDSGLPLDAIVAGAEERLEADEAQMTQIQRQLEEELARQEEDAAVEPVFQTPEPTPTPTTSTSWTDPEPAPVPTPTPTPTPTPVGIVTDGMTVDQINKLFVDYNIVEIPAGVSVTVGPEETAAVTIDSGKKLTVDGTLTIGSSGTLTNSGTLTVSGSGTLAVAPDTSSGGSMTNSGTVTVQSSGTLAIGSNGFVTNEGAFTNQGIIVNDGNLSNGGYIVARNETRAATNATMTNESGGTIQGSGSIYNYGTWNNLGTINSEQEIFNYGGTCANSGTITGCNIQNGVEEGSSTFENTGQIEISSGDTFRNGSQGSLINSGSITNSGTITNNEGGTITNSGTITNDGTYTGPAISGGTINGTNRDQITASEPSQPEEGPIETN